MALHHTLVEFLKLSELTIYASKEKQISFQEMMIVAFIALEIYKKRNNLLKSPFLHEQLHGLYFDDMNKENVYIWMNIKELK